MPSPVLPVPPPDETLRPPPRQPGRRPNSTLPHCTSQCSTLQHPEPPRQQYEPRHRAGALAVPPRTVSPQRSTLQHPSRPPPPRPASAQYGPALVLHVLAGLQYLPGSTPHVPQGRSRSPGAIAAPLRPPLPRPPAAAPPAAARYGKGVLGGRLRGAGPWPGGRGPGAGGARHAGAFRSFFCRFAGAGGGAGRCVARRGGGREGRLCGDAAGGVQCCGVWGGGGGCPGGMSGGRCRRAGRGPLKVFV